MSICVATIVSANYLAYARVLSESVAKQLPGSDFKVLVVDRGTKEVRDAVSDSQLDVTLAEELGLADFETLAFKYELVELNTALKPTFLKRLFADGHERVAYIDPDICLFDPLGPVSTALDRYEIVLTPHALAPALDGQRPSDIDFLRSGTLNLGFIALKKGRESISLLNWWESRCLSYGFNDLGFGTFVDQKWMELAPSYFDSVHILRDPSCNVAYWNLHERTLSLLDSVYMVGSKPLSFFHFSGVRANDPMSISRHQTRHVIADGSPLASLYGTYCASLLRFGHERFSTIRYTFGRFDDGTAVSAVMRRASCFLPSGGAPFSAKGPLFKMFLDKGWVRTDDAIGGVNQTTLNFDQSSKRVSIVNFAVRVAARILGENKCALLLKYLSFLSRESNYARVLFGKDLLLEHNERRR